MSAENVTLQDMKSIIADNVRAELARTAQDAVEKAADAAARAKREGTEAALVAGATGGNVQRATVDQRTLQVLHDPHKGKGLGFARAIKAMAVAQIDRRSPQDVANVWAKQGHRDYAVIADALAEQSRAWTQGALTAGGSLVPTEMASEVIELLYPATVALRLGARTIDFSGSLSLGKVTAGASIGYVGEASNITPSQPTTGELRLTGKKAAALVAVSNEMLRNPNVGADAVIRDDLLAALAVRRDLSFFRGAGDTYQPKGMNKWLAAANSFGQAGTTTANKIADLVKAIRLVDESNVLADGSMPAFAMSPRTKWGLFATVDGNSNLVFAAMLSAGNIFGAPVAQTTSIPNNLGGGTESEIYCGKFSDAIIGFDQANPLQLEAFPNGTYFDGSSLVSGISADQTPIRLIEGHDVLLRHDTSFSQITAVTWA
ncbi:MAG: hypothetical protein AMXMBFR56_72410 [Polyangiaceae bacterium]